MRIHSTEALGKPIEPQAGAGRPPSDRLRSFVDQSTVFMLVKGTPMMPQCGFSATVIEIMNRLGVPYATFNVLADPEIRNGAKEFSSWPTFPQIYVGGEFIGGCDIAIEMYQSGELAKVVEEAVEAHGVGTLHDGSAPAAAEPSATPTIDAPDTARASGDGAAEVQQINPRKVELLGREHFLFIDVREPDEFEHTHIDGSVPFPMAHLGSRFDELPRDANLLLVCRTGNRSDRAGQFLVAKGFRHVYNLVGGTNAWSDEVDSSIQKY